MTLSSTDVKDQYSGDGSTSSFAINFVFWDPDDPQVILTDSDGNDTTWTRGTQYTITGGGGSTGTVEVVTTPIDYTPASGETLTVISNLSDLQETEIPLGGPLPSDDIEQQLDQIVRMIQQRTEEVNRALIASVVENSIGTLPLLADRKGKFLAFDSDTGDPVASSAVDAELVSSFMATVLDDLTATAARGTLQVPTPNLLLNGAFDVWQHGDGPFTAATNQANDDDTYLADQWLLLSDGNDIVDVAKETTEVGSHGAYASISLEVETANKKFGILQPLESRDVIPLRGQEVSLSFRVKDSSVGSILNLRAGIVEWTGTADSITSDIISAWNDAGTNPTLATNWTFLNTPADITISSDFELQTIEGISVGASANNLAVIIWADNTDLAVDDIIYISDVKLERSSVATPFQRRTYGEELNLCKRFLFVFGPTESAASAFFVVGMVNLSTQARFCMQLPVEMRTAPTTTFEGVWRILSSGTTQIATTSESAPSTNATKWHVHLIISVASGLTAGEAVILEPSNINTSKINCDARL